VNGVELDWLETGNATPENTTPGTPAGRLLLEYMAGTWERDGGNLEAIMKELFPLVLENIKKSQVENVFELEATSLQQSGLHADISASNLAVSHPDNMLGTTSPTRIAGTGSETPGDVSVAPSGAEAFHNSKAQSRPDHQYTSLLWEYGTQIGLTPLYEKSQLSLTPSLWSCKATFGGKSAEGQGRSFQVSKHEASRKLCNDLGLD
jgi:hypothetical protein